MSLTPNEKDLLAKKSDLEGILKPDANDILHLPDITISLAENQQGYSTSMLTKDGLTLGSGGTITGITSSSGNSTSLAASQSMVSAKQDKIIAGTNIQIAQDGKTISATDTNELENLTDVNITTPTGGQGLVYNNITQKWENGNVSSASSIDTLTDVNLTNLTDGQVLKYDSTNQEWINANDSGGGTLTELNDVNISTPVNGQGLIYDSTNNEWINGTVQSGGGARQDVLYVASTMAETQISIDFTKYDEYIIYANDVLITQQIPQGVSFPKTVIEKAIADNSNITIYGYSSAACAYTVTSNSLTKISSSGGYTITMIVGVRGSGVAALQGLDYENAIDLSLPDFTGYSYTPTDYGVLMLTSYGPAGGISINSQKESVKVLAIEDDCWTTSWVPITKDETYTLQRASSTYDFVANSWFKFVPWLISNNSESYSATEQRIGTWVDGSDLYKKTIHLTGTYSSDGAIDISSYLTGNENIIESVGYLSYVYEGSVYKHPINGNYTNLEYRVDKYQLRLLLGSGSINMDAYITIKYTKV